MISHARTWDFAHKIGIFSNPSVKTFVLGVQKNHLIEHPVIKYTFLTRKWLVLNRVACNGMRCIVQGGKSVWDVLSRVAKIGMGYFVLHS